EAPTTTSTTIETTTTTSTSSTTSTTIIVCGDGRCDPPVEECVACESDCGTCPAGCGDGVCDAGERCETCPHDCGFCQATPTIPIAVAACAFQATCCDDSCLPSFGLGIDVGTAVWTGFFSGGADATVRSFISRGPCVAPGPSAVIPTVQVGDLI